MNHLLQILIKGLGLTFITFVYPFITYCTLFKKEPRAPRRTFWALVLIHLCLSLSATIPPSILLKDNILNLPPKLFHQYTFAFFISYICLIKLISLVIFFGLPISLCYKARKIKEDMICTNRFNV